MAASINSEVEPGGAFIETFCCDRVNVALPQNDVVGASDLNLIAIVRVEEHLVARFHAADVGTRGNNFGPREALADLGGSRNQNPSRTATLTFGVAVPHQDAVVKHLYRKALIGGKAVALLGLLARHGAQRYR